MSIFLRFQCSIPVRGWHTEPKLGPGSTDSHISLHDRLPLNFRIRTILPIYSIPGLQYSFSTASESQAGLVRLDTATNLDITILFFLASKLAGAVLTSHSHWIHMSGTRWFMTWITERKKEVALLSSFFPVSGVFLVSVLHLPVVVS